MILPGLLAFLLGGTVQPIAPTLPVMYSRTVAETPIFKTHIERENVTEGVTIHVDTQATGVTISPYLYGIFFEEINHAGDGGLYAELVRNRSFEDGKGGMDGWAVNVSAGGKVDAVQDASQPLNANNRNGLRLTIRENPGEVTVMNGGYWGMQFKKGATYRFSLYARAIGSGSGPMAVRLLDPSGNVIGKAQLPALSAEWRKVAVSVRADADTAKGTLCLAIGGTGSVHLDMVSLFPERTFQDRPNGMRRDLAETVAAMRPRFMRFPGGCFVEGETMDAAFRWKNTLGAIEQRPQRACLWGYQSTEGLGFHEYLQFCEDVRATPLLVVNCGMAHRNTVPMNEMAPWVQDALDAIEYANGPVTSEWGAKRAKNGHPRPFGLRFIEIGNENGGPDYEARFPLFVDAIRKKYPDIKIIADVWGGTPKSRPFDLMDEHYYSNPDFFFQNADRYDGYDRKGPKIYVGEYAVTEAAGTGNLHAALGEAAFMIGMERNSDVVEMASYAPLFVHAENRAWNPDAIVFNSGQVFGTPSYHVQSMFSNNLAEVALPTKVTVAPSAAGIVTRRPPENGAVGLGTWNTLAEFKDISVTDPQGKPLSVTVERPLQGKWQHSGDTLSQIEPGTDKRIVLGDPAWTDYTYSLQARKIEGEEGFLIPFRVRDERNLYWLNLGGWRNTQHAVERTVNGAKSVVGKAVPGSIESGRWYRIRIEVRGSEVRCYLDDTLLISFVEPGTRLFHATVGRSRGGYLVKVVNGAETPVTSDIALEGWNTSAQRVKAEATILTGESLSAENSFDAPERMAPKSAAIDLPLARKGKETSIRYTFPARSVTVLRFK